VFGHLSLLTGERRTATVVGSSEPTVLLRLTARDAWQTLTDVLGGEREMARRVELLQRVELFYDFSYGEIVQLAAVVEKVVYEAANEKVVEQGKRGRHMYIIWEGNLSVHVESVGRVNELTDGEMFGEAALVSETCYRTSTVKTTGPAVLLRLAQDDWHRVLSDERCLEVLSKAVVDYDARQKLRASPKIDFVMRKYYEIMVVESARLLNVKAKAELRPTHARWQMLRTQVDGTRVSREAYTHLHLIIAKCLHADFDRDEAVATAQKEWVEDIVAFSGDSSVNVMLEELKISLREATKTVVYKMSWNAIFEMVDKDGSGELDVMEFIEAARTVMHIPPQAVSDRELKLLFETADDSDDRAISAAEFSAFVSQPPHAVEIADKVSKKVSKATQANVRSAMTMLQRASHKVAMKTGWSKLFQTYDRDGQGSLDQREFTAIIREDCQIDAQLIPDESLVHLFNAVDADGTGDIDAHEFQARKRHFLSHLYIKNQHFTKTGSGQT
jgi:Ca2+-binding EF-hand superfamily protein